MAAIWAQIGRLRQVPYATRQESKIHIRRVDLLERRFFLLSFLHAEIALAVYVKMPEKYCRQAQRLHYLIDLLHYLKSFLDKQRARLLSR